MEHYIGEKLYKPVASATYSEAARWCNGNDAHIEDKGEYFEICANVHSVTVQDYDDAMETHLDSELVARGYTKRSPIEYTNSTNARWKQDAVDWQAHLDAVMTYGLEIMNKFEAGEPVPTLEEFKAALPQIVWTVQTI